MTTKRKLSAMVIGMQSMMPCMEVCEGVGERKGVAMCTTAMLGRLGSDGRPGEMG